MNIKKLVISALFCTLTTIATMILKVPTPTHGYIHIGDGLVLLCGIILGPVTGGLAAGLGSMLADIFTGYFIFAPITFLIKALAAFITGTLFHIMRKNDNKVIQNDTKQIIFSGIAGSGVVTIGYFIYESILYSIPSATVGIYMNLLQNLFGIIIAVLLMPILIRIRVVKELMKR